MPCFVGHRLDEPREVLRARARPRCDRTLVQREVGVRHDELGVDLVAGAEAVARLARAVRRVEREVAGSELVERGAARRAGEVLAEREDLGLGLFEPFGDDLHLGDTFGEPKRCLERVGETALDAVTANEPVDDDLDRVLLVAGETRRAVADDLGEVANLAVDASPHEPLARQVGEQRLVVALSPAHDRCEHLEPRAVGQLEDAVDDLLRSLAFDPRAVVRAVRDPDARDRAGASSRRPR